MKNKILNIFRSSTGKDTFVSMIGLSAIAGAGMLFTVLMARGLSTEAFGVFSALSSLATLIASMADLGLSAALVNFIPKLRDKRQILISTCFWFQVIVALVTIFLLFNLGFVHSLIVPGSSQFQFLLVGLLVAVYVFQGLATALFSAERNFIESSLVQGIDSFLKLLFVYLFFIKGSVSIEIAFISNLFSCAISIFYGLRYEFKNIRPIFPKAQIQEIFVFARWIALSRVFSTAISRLDVILLNALAGGFQAGIFAVAGRISMVFALLVSSLGSVMAPRFSSYTKISEVKSYLKKITMMITGVSLLMLVFVVLAEPIVILVFGERYRQAIPVFRFLTLAMIPFLYNTITTLPIIFFFNKPKFFANLTIIQVLILTGLNILLIPHLQAYAPPTSTLIANLFVLVVSTYKLRKLLNGEK